ncbi:MAG: transporter associated domain-containing protein [Clostridia bacterium]
MSTADFPGSSRWKSIIEEIVGDIDDEYDEEETEFQKISDDTYVIDGSMDLDDLDEELGVDLESENSETLGGFIIDILGEIPDENDVGNEIIFENYVFKIDSIKDRRIEKITMKILPVSDEDEDGDDSGKHDKNSRHEKREKRDKHDKTKETEISAKQMK